MAYEIMKKRCKGCIAPEVDYNPTPDAEDMKALVEAGKVSPEDAVWSCKATCTTRNLEKRSGIKGCRGAAIYFGAVA